MKTTIKELAQELAELEASLIEVTHQFDVYLDQIPVDQRVAASNLIQFILQEQGQKISPIKASLLWFFSAFQFRESFA